MLSADHAERQSNTLQATIMRTQSHAISHCTAIPAPRHHCTAESLQSQKAVSMPNLSTSIPPDTATQ